MEQWTKKGSSLSQASPSTLPFRAECGMRVKNVGGIRDYSNFSGRMWDKKISLGTAFAHFDRRDAG